ncbi:MAG: hypothetical protein WC823_02145 [Parcubacteria group bacterium]|jgi:hypothetical protein
MPIYKFEETVKEIVGEKGMSLFGSHTDLLWQIKKDLESREISADEVPEKMKENKDFRLNFSRDDFETIVKAIK